MEGLQRVHAHHRRDASSYRADERGRRPRDEGRHPCCGARAVRVAIWLKTLVNRRMLLGLVLTAVALSIIAAVVSLEFARSGA